MSSSRVRRYVRVRHDVTASSGRFTAFTSQSQAIVLPCAEPTQDAADDRATGEDTGDRPECGVVAVRQGQPGQGLAADAPGRGAMGGDISRDRRGGEGVPQLWADRSAAAMSG